MLINDTSEGDLIPAVTKGDSTLGITLINDTSEGDLIQAVTKGDSTLDVTLNSRSEARITHCMAFFLMRVASFH